MPAVDVLKKDVVNAVAGEITGPDDMPGQIGIIANDAAADDRRAVHLPFIHLSGGGVGAVRNVVGICVARLRQIEFISSSGEVNWLIGGLGGERLPAIDFAHVDLS